MSDSTEKSAYFYRIITLVVDVGTETLRDTFYSKVPKADVISKFSCAEIVREFKHLNTVKKVLSKVQYEKVTVSPDPDSYDITLLLILLTNKKVSGISAPKNGWSGTLDPSDDSLGANLVRLREIRNELVGHRANTQMQETEFNSYWGRIETVLKKIAGCVDKTVEDKITQKIKDAQTRILEPLDDREKKLLQVFLEWRKEEDEKNQALLLSVQSSLENLHLKVDGLPKSPTDETDAVRAEDTLSSLQSQVNTVAESLGGVAQQTCVQEIHQNVENMRETIDRLCQTVELLQKQLDENRKENERYKQEIAQLSRAPGIRSPEPQILYQRQLQTRPKVRNPNAMSEKEIMELSKKIGYEWEQLRIHLDFTEAQGFALKRAYDDDIQMRIHAMLKAWHDVVAECGENPRMLLAAAFVNASKNYSLAYKLVPRENFNAKAEAKQQTVERIQEIAFSKSGHYGDQRDGNFHTGRNSPYGYGGQGSFNVFGGEVRIEGSLAIHSSPSDSSVSSLVSSDGVDGGRPTSASHSFNMYEGRVVMGEGSNVVIGPPVSNYQPQADVAGVRGEGLDVPDSGQSSGSSSRGCGQPFKKKVDDTLCQSMVSTLNELMKSVGVLVSYGNPVGTVFCVGSKYVMTALHVMRPIVDPSGSGDADLTHLENTNTFINFNESPVTPAKQPYYLKKEFIYNMELDVAVLEISNPSNLPMKMNLHKPRLFETQVKNVALIGFGHTGHEKKCLESKCEIINLSSERMKSALASLQQNRGRYRHALQQTNKDPDVVDKGYTGYDHPSKLVFDCFMEHGASGAPALTNNNERSVEVVGVLTHGLPDFYFELPEIMRAHFPKEYRVELGTKMTSIHDWIKALGDEALFKDMFY